MKSLELMKSIELLELIGLIGLIEPNQVNKNLIHVHFFRHYFNRIYIEGPRQNYLFFKTVYQGEEVGGKRTKKE